jgi:hypothetical protein
MKTQTVAGCSAAFLLLCWAALWLWFERAHSREVQSANLWMIRLTLLTWFVLVANLIVLWWYALTTSAQLRHAKEQARRRKQPCVVIDYQPRGDDGWDFVHPAGEGHHPIRLGVTKTGLRASC